jgi:SAM-dependent methyltransferase
MDAVFDRVLLVHAIEEAATPHAMLREIWRVMAPEGRLVVIAANRWSLWAQSDATPFGHGRPYSRTQLAALLSDSMFEPVVSARALYTPPSTLAALGSRRRCVRACGRIMWPAQGGVVLMEAVKRLYASTARSGACPFGQSAGAKASYTPRRQAACNKRDLTFICRTT